MDLFKLIAETPNLTWLILTKRIGNVMGMCSHDGLMFDQLANIWLGATVVNQEEADRDIPKLLQIPAKVRFLSMEPLLGLVDLRFEDVPGVMLSRIGTGIDWVIVGGESGAKARPMHPDWAYSLRDQCAAAGVPYFFKQWGEYAPTDKAFNPDKGMRLFTWGGENNNGVTVDRVGNKAAGNLLSNIPYQEFPA